MIEEMGEDDNEKKSQNINPNDNFISYWFWRIVYICK